MFRLLGLWPGADLSLPAGAALLGLAVEPASELAERLVDMHMLETPTEHRYRFHDLIAVFAAECAEADEPADRRVTDGPAAKSSPSLGERCGMAAGRIS